MRGFGVAGPGGSCFRAPPPPAPLTPPAAASRLAIPAPSAALVRAAAAPPAHASSRQNGRSAAHGCTSRASRTPRCLGLFPASAPPPPSPGTAHLLIACCPACTARTPPARSCTCQTSPQSQTGLRRSEERRVGKECR